MVKDVEDVEEGEISDTSSMKVIIEKDFNKVSSELQVILGFWMCRFFTQSTVVVI